MLRFFVSGWIFCLWEFCLWPLLDQEDDEGRGLSDCVKGGEVKVTKTWTPGGFYSLTVTLALGLPVIGLRDPFWTFCECWREHCVLEPRFHREVKGLDEHL